MAFAKAEGRNILAHKSRAFGRYKGHRLILSSRTIENGEIKSDIM